MRPGVRVWIQWRPLATLSKQKRFGGAVACHVKSGEENWRPPAVLVAFGVHHQMPFSVRIRSMLTLNGTMSSLEAHLSRVTILAAVRLRARRASRREQ